MPLGRRLFATLQPRATLLSWGDAVVLIGLAAILFFAISFGTHAPRVIEGAAINLGYIALPYYAVLSLGRMAAAYALSLGFAVTFLLTGLVAAALLHAFRNLAGIEIRPLAASETFAGGRVAFTLSVCGGDRARESLEVRAGDAGPVVVDIPAGANVAVRLERPAERRGRYALGRVTLSSTQPLGLWRAWSYVHFPLAGIVYPEPEPGAPPLPHGAHGHDLTAPGMGEE